MSSGALLRSRWLAGFVVASLALATTPRASDAQHADRLVVGVRRPAMSPFPAVVGVTVPIQAPPRRSPTRQVVAGAVVGGLVGVVVRRSTSNCDGEVLSGLCRDAATINGLVVGAAVGAVTGLLVWIVTRPGDAR